MKVESGIIQPKCVVDKVGEMAHISLFTNKNEVEKEGDPIYEYDYYFLEVPYRENIEVDVEINFDKWLEMAIGKENEANIPKPLLEELQLEYIIELDYRLSLIEMGLM